MIRLITGVILLIIARILFGILDFRYFRFSIDLPNNREMTGYFNINAIVAVIVCGISVALILSGIFIKLNTFFEKQKYLDHFN